VFDRLSTAPERSPAFEERNAFVKLTVAVVCGGEQWTVRIEDGLVEAMRGRAPSADLIFSASSEDWKKYALAEQPRGFTAIAAMQRTGALAVEGDMLLFHRHQFSIEEMFRALRPDTPKAATSAAAPAPRIEAVVGRYLNLSLRGKPHRLYYEEAGAGIPLLCLHTAGSDSRQYRAILNDEEITRDFRVVAFDMPRHGKSSPPEGYEQEVYRLTTDAYLDMILAVVDALDLDRPAVLGCSIGGRVVLQLGIRHADRFRAGIGLQSAPDANPGQANSFRSLNVGHRPDVNAGEASAARVAPLIAPTAPRREAWETLWHYMQAGPGVFDGDTEYYFDTGTLTEAEVARLRQSGFPLYFLTGDYDLGVAPDKTRELAEIVGARSFQTMIGLGHFPMSEDPVRFRAYLKPILDDIRRLRLEQPA
jgi:pimeloyl-ACP methyl ester carboxylesterase